MNSPTTVVNWCLGILLVLFVSTYGAALLYVRRAPAMEEILSLARQSKSFRRAVGNTAQPQWDFSLIQRRKNRTVIFQLHLPVQGERGSGVLLATIHRTKGRLVLKKLILDRSGGAGRTKARRKQKVRIKLSAAPPRYALNILRAFRIASSNGGKSPRSE